MHKYLEKMDEVTFDKIFNQKLGELPFFKLNKFKWYNFVQLIHLGFLMFRDFCENVCDESVPQLKFYEEVSLDFDSL